MSTHDASTPQRRPIPHFRDIERWLDIKRREDWKGIWNEDLVASLRSWAPGTPRGALNVICQRVHGELTRILTKGIRKSYPNGGMDLVEDARSRLLAAIFDPNSLDGAALSSTFELTVCRRGTDAVNRHLRQDRGNKIASEIALLLGDGLQHDVSSALSIVMKMIAAIPNAKQRKAYLMMLEGALQAEIAEETGVTTRTVRTWVQRFRTILLDMRNEGML